MDNNNDNSQDNRYQQPQQQQYQPYQNYAYGYTPYPYPSNTKKKKRWPIVLLIIAAVLLLFSVLVWAAVISMSGGTDNRFSSPDKTYIAKVSVVGEIGGTSDPYTSSNESYHHAWTMSMIDNIKKDSKNAGLIIVVDSPGGGVYESDELYEKIQAYMKETKRPVYVYMRSMAASGGYYISAPATEIFANRNTWTGSIGVIVGTMFDVSGFLKEHGITAENITSGPNKDMGSYFTPMTKEQRAIFQSMVDEAYGQFVGIVAEGRGMTEEQVRKIADGRILTSNQAKNEGLIDEILGEDDFYDAVRKKMGNKDMYINDIVYNASDDFMSSILPSFIKSLDKKPQQDISRVLELAQSDGKVPLKYMYMGA